MVKAFGSSDKIFVKIIVDLKQVHGVGDIFATAISFFDADRAKDRELGLAQKKDISILTLTSEEYLE